MKLELGKLVVTTNALRNGVTDEDIHFALDRHREGDWGNVDAHDKAANNAALNEKDPQRVLSSYESLNGTKFWIITEWDRSVTTVLLPEDY